MPRHRVIFGLSCALLLLQMGGRAFAEDVPTSADRDDDSAEDADATAAVMFAPLAIAFGVFGGEADLVVRRSLAVSLDAAASRPDGATLGALGVGLLIYPLRPAFHGWYLLPRLAYTHILGQSRISGLGALSVVALSGWQWTWDYGLSIRLGAGVAGSTRGAPVSAPELHVGPLGLVADAGLGWAW
jgi:hypothetical protein